MKREDKVVVLSPGLKTDYRKYLKIMKGKYPTVPIFIHISNNEVIQFLGISANEFWKLVRKYPEWRYIYESMIRVGSYLMPLVPPEWFTILSVALSQTSDTNSIITIAASLSQITITSEPSEYIPSSCEPIMSSITTNAIVTRSSQKRKLSETKLIEKIDEEQSRPPKRHKSLNTVASHQNNNVNQHQENRENKHSKKSIPDQIENQNKNKNKNENTNTNMEIDDEIPIVDMSMNESELFSLISTIESNVNSNQQQENIKLQFNINDTMSNLVDDINNINDDEETEDEMDVDDNKNIKQEQKNDDEMNVDHNKNIKQEQKYDDEMNVDDNKDDKHQQKNDHNHEIKRPKRRYKKRKKNRKNQQKTEEFMIEEVSGLAFMTANTLSNDSKVDLDKLWPHAQCLVLDENGKIWDKYGNEIEDKDRGLIDADPDHIQWPGLQTATGKPVYGNDMNLLFLRFIIDNHGFPLFKHI